MYRIIFAVLINFNGFFSASSEEPHVHLPIGSLIGRERATTTGFKYYSYQGIPFAEPPIGALRFLAPIERKPWQSVHNATYERTQCYQTSSTIGSEDCLYLNVYTPSKPSTNRRLPVMFYIFGGAFLYGSAAETEYGADHLVEKDIVVVETNYRLGAFGFLSSGDDVIPGNAGLKDQVLALKWTQKYIKYFGGDPRKVTIFGQSAGSASVAYHLLSPLSRDLFWAGIAQSGSALAPWALNRNQTKISYDLAKLIDPDQYPQHSSSSVALRNYLQSVSAELLNAVSGTIQYSYYYLFRDGFFFGPVLEVEHKGAFVTKRQFEQFQKGHFSRVPVIIGFNTDEQVVLFSNPDFESLVRASEAYPESLVPLDMNVKPKLKSQVAKLIYDHYSPNETLVESPRNLVNYVNDQWFIRSIHKQAQLQSNHSSVWFYQFAYKGTMTNLISTPVMGFSPDVSHGEELSYIFAIKVADHNTTDVSIFPESDILVHRRLVTLWTNFAKYRNPTPVKDELFQNITWPLFDISSGEKFLDIGSYLEIKSYPQSENVEFWEGLYDTYGNRPFDTY